MSTSFNFPDPATAGQVVTLPDGSKAQYTGLAWVAVEDNVTYPLSVPNGGTGATNPLTARINLGLSNADDQRIFADGTAAKPGAAFASEPGLGFYRPTASVLNVAAQGQVISTLAAQNAAGTTLGLYPRSTGTSSLNIYTAASGNPNQALLGLGIDAAGNAYLSSVASGSGTAKRIVYTAPIHDFNGQVNINNTLYVTPNIELGSSTVAQATFIDWHVDGSGSSDYNFRMLVDSGQPARMLIYGTGGAGRIFFSDAQGGLTNAGNIANSNAGDNVIAFGWRTDSKLGLRVDNTQFGASWPIDIGGNAAGANRATSAVRVDGQDRCNNWGFSSGDSRYPYMRLDNTDPVRMLLWQTSNDSTVYSFRAAGSPYYLEVTGSIGAYSVAMTPSDERLKENIEDSTVDATAALRRFRFIEFDWARGQTGHAALGLSAQNLQAIEPSMANAVEQPEGSPMADLGAVLNRNDPVILAYLGKALQETIARLDALEAA